MTGFKTQVRVPDATTLLLQRLSDNARRQAIVKTPVEPRKAAAGVRRRNRKPSEAPVAPPKVKVPRLYEERPDALITDASFVHEMSRLDCDLLKILDPSHRCRAESHTTVFLGGVE